MQLLPPGRALKRDTDGLIYATMQGAAEELVRVSGRVEDLFRESDPRQTVELLPDFEAMRGLEPNGTTTERRNRVIAHLLRRSRFRPVDFQTVLAAVLGLDASQIPVIETSRALAVIIDDAQEIYRFFVYRDPGLGGSYDLDSAQDLIDSMAPSHPKGHVIESIDFLCDDPYSLCDRDLLGGGEPMTFEVVTGLVADNIWTGASFTDLVGSLALDNVGVVDKEVAIPPTGLRKVNHFSSLAFQFDDNVAEALELPASTDFDFDAAAGPSWLFVLVFATTGGIPAGTRCIWTKRDNLGNGWELTMDNAGFLTWTVGTGARTLAQGYGNDRWHVVVLRWRYDTDELDCATELGVGTPAAAGTTTVDSTVKAALGRGQNANALGCTVSYLAACSGEQVHDADIGALATRIHDILVPNITLP